LARLFPTCTLASAHVEKCAPIELVVGPPCQDRLFSFKPLRTSDGLKSGGGVKDMQPPGAIATTGVVFAPTEAKDLLKCCKEIDRRSGVSRGIPVYAQVFA